MIFPDVGSMRRVSTLAKVDLPQPFLPTRQIRSPSTICRLIFLKTGVPENLTAAGRGEYAPLLSNETAEGKAKNRRTDIILTPKLDELLSILNSQ